MNFFTGEQHVYSEIVLEELAKKGRIRQISYDIACRVHGRLHKIFEELRIGVNDPIWIDTEVPYIFVGPFHINCHNPSCQHAHGSLYKEGCGHANGELAESLNAYLLETLRKCLPFLHIQFFCYCFNSLYKHPTHLSLVCLSIFKTDGASYTLGINYVQLLDLKLQLFNDHSRSDIAWLLCRAIDRQRTIMTLSSQAILTATKAIAAEVEAPEDSEVAFAEFRRRCEKGRICHQSIAASAPPLDSSALVAIEIQAFWNRLLRVGVEMQRGVYQPSLYVDEDIQHRLPGYRPIPFEKVITDKVQPLITQLFHHNVGLDL